MQLDLTSLNPAQRAAVEHTHGPLLILAGAGSGKTRVLVHRIVHLVQSHHLAPSEILAVTFTNKAAREMRERLERMVGGVAGMWVTTFHAAGLRILRDLASLANLSRDFVIYDDDDQMKLLKGIVAAANVDDKQFPVRSFLQQISRAKDYMRTPDDVAKIAQDEYGELFAKIYAQYTVELRRARAVDFADLIMLPVQIFRAHPSELIRYRERFTSIMVDEYQDTNHSQYQLVQALAAGHQNLCVVGDIDQSIYGWRHADIRNILSFEKDYPHATVVTLEQNYRSTQTILKAANAVIVNNTNRKPKNLWTENAVGTPIIIRTHETDLDEAGFAARTIAKLVESGVDYQSIAIFYRVNAQSRVYEEALRFSSIPYKIFGGVSFYERREVKDLLAYLRLLVNPHDGVGLMRVINVPTRGIGKTTIDRLSDEAAQRGISLYEALNDSNALAMLNNAAQNKLAQFATQLRNLQPHVTATLPQLWDTLLAQTNYLAWLKEDDPETAADRLENVEELGRALCEFAIDSTSDLSPLQQFLDQIALVHDSDRTDDARGSVNLMTLHLAKGLEFPTVFMVGLEEGLFPHSRALDDPDELEEERRLCYVGMTRAEERLFMLYAERRRLHGREQYNIPSRFLKEIPRDLVEWQGRERLESRETMLGGMNAGNFGGFASRAGIGFAGGAGMRRGGASSTHDEITDVPYTDDGDQRGDDERAASMRIGTRVAHPMFGPGVIRKMEGAGTAQKVMVQFERAGLKTLMLEYANLQIMAG